MRSWTSAFPVDGSRSTTSRLRASDDRECPPTRIDRALTPRWKVEFPERSLGRARQRPHQPHEIRDDAKKRLPEASHPVPLDPEAEQPLRANNLCSGGRDRRRAEAGYPLDVLHGPDEEEPDHEQTREPAQPRRNASHEKRTTLAGFAGHLPRKRGLNGARQPDPPVARASSA